MIGILIGLIILISGVSFLIIRNLLIKNEKLTDFIAKQGEAIDQCDKRLKEIDSQGFFKSDDMVGWFFEDLKKIQEALNEFTLK